jgi:predicted nucleic acid-binding protein
MKDKIFLDSNIFLYAFSNQDNRKKVIASKLLLEKKHTISIQVVNEVSNILLRKFKFTNDEIEAFIKDSYSRYAIIVISEKIFLKACEVRKNYNISYYDSLILASAIESECDILYSEDMQHRQKVENLIIINPFIEAKENNDT